MLNKKLNQYYFDDTKRMFRFLVPNGSSAIHLKDSNLADHKKYDYILVDNLIGSLLDVQDYFQKIKGICKEDSRLIVTYYNFLWEPILKLASFLGLRKKIGNQNWLNHDDIANLLNLAGFDIITRQKRLLIPIDIPFISNFINQWIAPLPLINVFCLKTWTIARLKPKTKREYSVSIVVPARNEEGNIPNIVPRIPKFGLSQEIIFIEGHSKDNTWTVIQNELKKKFPKYIKVKAYQQKGIGKANAVRLGFSKSTGDMLIILDADMTVAPRELPKFYEALAEGLGEFANGSRLVYPMEKSAMNFLNLMGNRIFSWLFSWILGQSFKDTLCGTKVLFKKDYLKISRNRKFFGDFDPFGDYDLIFGAIKQNLKVIEIPTRYKEREYGTTNISRFTHGWLLFKMTLFAYKKFGMWDI